MERKIKHLEFIQAVITRMNSNSFLIKGWGITIVSGIIALCIKDNANLNYIYLSYIPIILFWLLDGFFLSTERQYRDLYKEVAAKSETEIDYNMDASKFCKGNRTWIAGIFSKTLIPFYGISILLSFVALLLIK